MTWGSNASFERVRCPYCGNGVLDDTDAGENTHMRACPWRSSWKHFLWKYFNRGMHR